MKMIHCADLHLDSKMESNLSKEQAEERRDELFSTFVRMVDYAKDNRVRIIVIAGDMFDTSRDTRKRIKSRVLEQIREAGAIDFLYLRGNHDRVDFFDTLKEKPENLKLFHEGWTGYDYEEGITVTGRELVKNTGSSIYSNLSLKSDRINIVVLHGQESGYEKKEDEDIINLIALQNRNIDYLALGHIHTYKADKLDNRGIYCYSGCLEGRGFDECGDKGFVLLETEEGKIRHSFIPFAKRSLHEVRVPLSGKMTEGEILQTMEGYLSDIPKKDLVKVILLGETEEQTDIDLRYLLGALDGRFYYIKIYDETRLMIRYEDYEKDISLKGEFIRLVQSQDMEEDLKRKIILTGLKALAGREIDL